MVMVSANDLIVLFLGLETLSLSLYLLAASHRKKSESQEAGLKYFILGGFASAFFLYGIALVYGVTGSTNISKVGSTLASEVPRAGMDAMLLVGIGLLLVGLAFKVSAVPFHVWTPDVYQGAPSPVTAFMASAGKVAAFAALMRIVVVAFPTRFDDWRPVIWVLAVLTVTVGSVLAVVQTNVKRLLAFSSVSHAGFILVGFEAAGHSKNHDAIAAVVVYLVLYVVLVIGSFAVVTVVAGSGDSATSLDDFRGLAKRRPALALALTVFLLGQAGMPATTGFIAKFGVIRAAVESHSYVIATIAMVAAVIAAFLYLRIMVSMWLDEPASDSAVHVPRGAAIAIFLAAAFTIVVGVFPGWLLNAADTVNSLVSTVL
jgi:NADH-quinone oxidoreductase subunit N